jgi:bifunctional enzyme CysN/CysC
MADSGAPKPDAPAASTPHARTLRGLRFLTCGSVDDGKSTLIGRLLYESHLILDDQLRELASDSAKYGAAGGEIDFALLVDGLEAEREQGITIDVAYRYFATPHRSFVVADCPGHEQFTRNMATGASNSELAVLLVDARKGLLTQTKRHAAIVSLLGIRRAVLAVNKMDLVRYDRAVFDAIVARFHDFAEPLGFSSLQAIPMSARQGDNVCGRSANMPWYDGPPLLEHLERAEPGVSGRDLPMRFPVQWVNRPHQDFRGLAGTLASGRVAVGDEIVVATYARTAKVKRIVAAGGDVAAAEAGDAITLVLDKEIDVARGDVLCHPSARPAVVDQFAARLIWMGDEKLLPGRSYLLKIGGRTLPATVSEIKYKLDVDHQTQAAAKALALNEIGQCNLSLAAPVAIDSFAANHTTGSFILIDRTSNATAAAGMIDFALRRATNIHLQKLSVDKAARAALKHQRPIILWFTGLSGSGKSTVANLVEVELLRRHAHATLLDGDNVRHGLNRDLGFTDVDRVENIRRIGEVAKLMVDAGLIVLCSFISPFAAERRLVRELVADGEFVEIFLDTPLDVCIQRDPKGLYKRALTGEIKNFTGVSQPYERPVAPELAFGADLAAEEIAQSIVRYLAVRSIVTDA